MTDEERFNAAQLALSNVTVKSSVDTKKSKPQNVFAAAFESDSD
jgi:hypothetical protein